jgi:hypothetical protein
MNQHNQYKFGKCFNMRLCVIISSVVLLVSYGIFNARNLLLGPTIEIFTSANNSETGNNVFTINGRAKNIAFISLNERPISVDTDGIFEEKLLLSPGANAIEIKAKDRFKNETKKTLNIYYKQSTTTVYN